MKKIFFSSLLLSSSLQLAALPIGNPAEPGLLCEGILWEQFCSGADPACGGIWTEVAFRIGFYGDYVFNRHLDFDKGALKGHKFEKTELFTNSAFIAVNYKERAEFFCTLGETKIWM